MAEWLYNDVAIAQSATGNVTLIIPSVNDSLHNREYKCRITSPFGVQEINTTIITTGSYGNTEKVLLHKHCVTIIFSTSFICKSLLIYCWHSYGWQCLYHSLHSNKACGTVSWTRHHMDRPKWHGTQWPNKQPNSKHNINYNSQEWICAAADIPRGVIYVPSLPGVPLPGHTGKPHFPCHSVSSE